MPEHGNKYTAVAVAYASVVLGSGALLWFGAFVYAGSFSVWDFGFGPLPVLFTDAGLSLVFFLQHSTMQRRWFKARLDKYAARPFHGAVYGLSSAIALFIVLAGWQTSPHVLISAEGWYRLGCRLLFWASVAGFAWGVKTLGSFDSFGAKTLLRHTGNRPKKAAALTIRGPYKHVRHPLYFFTLLMIWSCPDVSADRLVFNVLWSAWIVTGAWLEEKDLVRDFGGQYRNYQRQVPMLIPWKTLTRR